LTDDECPDDLRDVGQWREDEDKANKHLKHPTINLKPSSCQPSSQAPQRHARVPDVDPNHRGQTLADTMLPEYGDFTNFDALDFLERELGENPTLRESR
jgi:hypothetical protein